MGVDAKHFLIDHRSPASIELMVPLEHSTKMLRVPEPPRSRAGGSSHHVSRRKTSKAQPRSSHRSIARDTSHNDEMRAQKYHRERGRVANSFRDVVVQRPVSRESKPREYVLVLPDPGYGGSGWYEEVQRSPSCPDSWSNSETYASSFSGVEDLVDLVPRPGKGPDREREPRELGLEYLASWYPEHAFVNDKEWRTLVSLMEEDIPVMPMTPREQRLPTPELAPMCTSFEFCACCEDELCACCGDKQDRIDNKWYQKGREKLDSQRGWPDCLHDI